MTPTPTHGTYEVLYISRVYVIFDTNEQPTMHKGPNVVMVEMQGVDVFEALSPPATAVAAATAEAAVTRAATATAATEAGAAAAASAEEAPRGPVEGEGKGSREGVMEGDGGKGSGSSLGDE